MAFEINPKPDSLSLLADSLNLPDNFIGIGVRLDKNGLAEHSGIVVGFNGNHTIAHFNGQRDGLIEQLNANDYVIVPLGSIAQNEDEAEAMLDQFKHVQSHVLEFGYVYSGHYFNEDGIVGETPIPETVFTTCVGFCLMLLKGFHTNQEHLVIDDWDENINVNEAMNNWIINFENFYPGIALDPIEAFLRRVTPAELFVSSYAQTIPIAKVEIDEHITAIEAVLAAITQPAESPQ